MENILNPWADILVTARRNKLTRYRARNACLFGINEHLLEQGFEQRLLRRERMHHVFAVEGSTLQQSCGIEPHMRTKTPENNWSG